MSNTRTSIRLFFKEQIKDRIYVFPSLNTTTSPIVNHTSWMSVKPT